MKVTTNSTVYSFLMIILMSGLLLSPFSFAKDEASASKPSLEQDSNASDSSGETVATVEATATPKPPKFKASYDRFFYEFKGVREASQRTNGVSNYSFERVTYDTQSLGLSYNIDPTLSLSVSNTYQEIYAETRFLGALLRDKTMGFGDTLIKGSKTLLRSSGIYVLEFGTLLPTGSITEKNANIPGAAINYPYNMQLGSGTNDFQLSATYLKILGKHQLGAFGMATVRTGRNDVGYRRGDEYMTRAFYSYAMNPYITPGIWANFLNIQGIHGKDPDFDDPVNDQLLRFYYNTRTFWDVTPNLRGEYPIAGTTVKLKGMLGAPLAQHSRNVDDIQLYTQWFMQTGIEGTF